MTKIRKPAPQTQKTGLPKTTKRSGASGAEKARGAEGVTNRSILILDGVDLSQIELRQKESSDQLTVQQGLREIASRVYGYGGKEEGHEQLVGKLAQVALLAAERVQLDPDLAKMMKPGLKQSLNPAGQSQLSDKQLDKLADQLVSALGQVLKSS